MSKHFISIIQNLRLELEIPYCGPTWSKIKHSCLLCQKFAVVCRTIAISCPPSTITAGPWCKGDDVEGSGEVLQQQPFQDAANHHKLSRLRTVRELPTTTSLRAAALSRLAGPAYVSTGRVRTLAVDGQKHHRL